MRGRTLPGIGYLIIIAMLLAALWLAMSRALPGTALERDDSLTRLTLEGVYRVEGREGEWALADEAGFAEAKGGVSIRGHFDRDIAPGEQIMLHMNNLRARVRSGGRTLFSHGWEDARAVGNAWSSFASGGIAQTEEIEIDLQCLYPGEARAVCADFLGQMYAGSEYRLFRNLYATSRATLFLGLAVVLLGFVTLLLALIGFWMRLPAAWTLLYLAGFGYAMGIVICAEVEIMSYLIPYPPFNRALYMTGLLAAPPLWLAYVRTFLRGRVRSCVVAGAVLALVFAVAALIGQLCGLCDLYPLRPVCCGIFAGGIILSAAALAWEALRKDNKAARDFLFTALALVLGGALEGWNHYSAWARPFFFFQLGFLAFVLLRLAETFTFIRQSVRTLLRARQLENELLQSKISVMLSQIKPHFLFNTLNAISGLCLSDPLKADEAICVFSDYLRANISSLEAQTPVRFAEELSHTRNYLAIESLRFGEKIRIVYDLAFEDFLLPTLTLQPLVENAVKHGLIPREKGGTVTISTRREGDFAVVTVLDDGVGFDTAREGRDGSIAIRNVRNRLRYMSEAELEIESRVGYGTRAVIKIPLDNAPPKRV